MVSKEDIIAAKVISDSAHAAASRLYNYFQKSHGLKIDPALFRCIFMEEVEKALGAINSDQPELCLLQNVSSGFIGNSPVFWAEGGGYTQWISDAKLWTSDEADLQIRSTRGSHSWMKWPLSTIKKHAKLTVDIQDLRKEDARGH